MTAPATVFEVDANDQLVWVYSPELWNVAVTAIDEGGRTSQPLFKTAFRSAEGTLYGD